MNPDHPTISDIETGAANYMLGVLQMTIAGNGSITAEQWQAAISETVAFQRRMVGYAEGLTAPGEG